MVRVPKGAALEADNEPPSKIQKLNYLGDMALQLALIADDIPTMRHIFRMAALEASILGKAETPAIVEKRKVRRSLAIAEEEIRV